MASEERPKAVDAADSGNSGFPTFIRRGPEGVLVDPAKMTVENAFRVFVERLFSQGARFSGLDYPCFQKLLFAAGEPDALPAGVVKVAREIVVFPTQRQALYKSLKLMAHGSAAEYMFEPAFLELASPASVPGNLAKTRLEPTRLDIDEFIAAMWMKGLCFGIDVDAVANAIAAGKVARITVATERAPKPAQDARLHEEWAGLHRDDSPLIRDGMADLRSHKNRFPQIRSQQRMLKKIPPQPGVPGYKVTGQRVEPDLPRDIDLKLISGPGTRVEASTDGEFIVAIRDGFLAFSPGSAQVSVTEKIDDASGVSAKTTGNLRLTVDEFVERGEVQDGCSVEGRHMKFMAAVYGSVISHAGRIELQDNLSGGRAASPGGSITVHKRASNARIEAPGGNIRISHAENCSVVGQMVVIEHAVNCDILADSVRIETAQGCSIAAKAIDIASAGAKNDRPSIVSMLIPDLSEFLRQAAALDKEAVELQSAAKTITAAMEKIESEPEFAKFKSLNEMLRQGSVKFTPTQEQSLRAVQIKHAPATRALEKLVAERTTLLQSMDGKKREVQKLIGEQAAMAGGRRCKITLLAGETFVQQMSADAHLDAWGALTKIELARVLSTYSAPSLQIYSGSQGSVDWKYELAPRMVA